MHHMLIDSGLTHMQATYILAFIQIVFIALSIKLQHLGSWPLIGVLLTIAILVATLLDITRKRYKKVKRKKPVSEND